MGGEGRQLISPCARVATHKQQWRGGGVQQPVGDAAVYQALQAAKAWEPGRLYESGVLCCHQGGLWRAAYETDQEPQHDSPDWDAKAKGEQVNQKAQHFVDMVAYTDKLVGKLVD